VQQKSIALFRYVRTQIFIKAYMWSYFGKMVQYKYRVIFLKKRENIVTNQNVAIFAQVSHLCKDS
jgi:hypothetical protein